MVVDRAPMDPRSMEAPIEATERETEASPLPAWPVLVLFWGTPIWWLLGLFSLSAIIMAVPMVTLMVLHRRAVLVPGVLPWAGLTLWVVPCALMLSSASASLAIGVQFANYAAILILLLYVVTARSSLPPARLLGALAAMWVAIIAGGYLGLMWPEGRLTLTVGQLLPGSLASHEYVRDLFFPAFAQIQQSFDGSQTWARPSAPFAYTNGWGAGMAVLTPVAIAWAYQRSSRVAPLVVVLGLAAAIPPAVATTNRGLFLTMGAAVGYVIIRLMLRGKFLALLALVAAAVIGIAVLQQAGLGERIAERQGLADTTRGRSELYAETLDRALQSPILGHGSSEASLTSEINVGTQGMLWSVVFAFGFVGLAFFAFFLFGAVVRTWEAPSTVTLWLHASLVSACLMSIYYGMDRQMVVLAVVIALMLRERYARQSDFWSSRRSSS